MMYRIENNKIIETSTNLVVYIKDDVKKLREVCRNLNLGGGFDAWTPPFFCKPIKDF